MTVTSAFVRIEIDLPLDAALNFAEVLRDCNSRPGEKFTPSELAASILMAVLEDDAVDLRRLDA
jgi:hypothetical protein